MTPLRRLWLQIVRRANNTRFVELGFGVTWGRGIWVIWLVGLGTVLLSWGMRRLLLFFYPLILNLDSLRLVLIEIESRCALSLQLILWRIDNLQAAWWHLVLTEDILDGLLARDITCLDAVRSLGNDGTEIDGLLLLLILVSLVVTPLVLILLILVIISVAVVIVSACCLLAVTPVYLLILRFGRCRPAAYPTAICIASFETLVWPWLHAWGWSILTAAWAQLQGWRCALEGLQINCVTVVSDAIVLLGVLTTCSMTSWGCPWIYEGWVGSVLRVGVPVIHLNLVARLVPLNDGLIAIASTSSTWPLETNLNHVPPPLEVVINIIFAVEAGCSIWQPMLQFNLFD